MPVDIVPQGQLPGLKSTIRRLVATPVFECAIFGLILFIAVVINNLEKSKAEELAALRQPVTCDELLKEMAATQLALARLRDQAKHLE